MKYSMKLVTAIAVCIMLWQSFVEARIRTKEPRIDPEKTRIAITTLMGAGQETIPIESTCRGNYGNQSKGTINDLLSLQLSYLFRGRNVITGLCSSEVNAKCQLNIFHSFGEDTSSIEIRFNVENSKIDLNTLRCVITP